MRESHAKCVRLGRSASVCGISGWVCQACAFFSATHLIGTGRVDISVPLLIGLIIHIIAL